MFQLIVQNVKKNYFVYFFALLVGLFSVGPHLVAKYSLGSSYQGFPFLFQANEDYYLTRIENIVRGHWFVGSPFLYEYKGNLPVVFPVGEYFYAIPIILFGASFISVIMVTKFLFPALLFILVYKFIYKNSNRTNFDKWSAIAGGLLVTLGFDFVDYFNALQTLLGRINESHLSVWTRPVNPISGILLLFTFLILFSNTIQSEKKYFPVFAGIVLGIMPGYIFSWLSAWAVLGIFGLITLLRKKFKLFAKLCLIGAVSLISSAPFWYSWLGSLKATDGLFVALRNGMLLTHAPILNKVTLLQTLLFVPFFIYEFFKQRKLGKELDSWWWVALTFVGANWLVFNYQIITGRTVWPPHLMQFAVPLAMVTFMLLLGNYFKKISTRFSWAIVIFVIIASLFYGFISIFSFRLEMPRFTTLQQSMPLFNWLNQNSQKDCVVLVRENEELFNNWIPAFTHCNVYISSYAFSRVPIDRLYYNYLITLRLRGIGLNTVDSYLFAHKGELKALFYTTWPQLFMKTDESWLITPIEKIKSSYGDFLKQDFTQELRRHRIDYLVGDEEFPASLTKQLKDVQLIGKFGSKYLYSLIKN